MSLSSEIATLLIGDAISKHPHVSVGSNTICGCDLKCVGAAVRDGRIKVEQYTPKPKEPKGTYQPSTNTFFFEFTKLHSLENKALVVHEAVHAALDINAAKKIKVLDSEALAYIHQAIFVVPYAKNAKQRLKSGNKTNDKTFKAAAEIARVYAAGDKPTNAQIMTLRSAIKQHGSYSHQHHTNAGYDGVN